jgi:predicted RNA-binding Zn-ribbon protein involved in translation (DUF1610 family)
VKCKSCGIETPRHCLTQRYCPQCAVEVAKIIDFDEKRRNRFRFAKALDFGPRAA